MIFLVNWIKGVEKYKSIKIYYRKYLLRLESEILDLEYIVYFNIFLDI